jgi:DNA-binding MarR family transcriptional regulator
MPTTPTPSPSPTPSPATSTVPSPRIGAIIEAIEPLVAHQRRQWASRCHARGFSIIGAHLLALLETEGEVPMSRLAEALDVALPNATGIVGRLAERGIVERRHGEEDRRVVLVRLTESGRELIAEMEGARRARLHRLISTMNDEQQERLMQVVHDLRAAARSLNEKDALR